MAVLVIERPRLTAEVPVLLLEGPRLTAEVPLEIAGRHVAFFINFTSPRNDKLAEYKTINNFFANGAFRNKAPHLQATVAAALEVMSVSDLESHVAGVDAEVFAARGQGLPCQPERVAT